VGESVTLERASDLCTGWLERATLGMSPVSQIAAGLAVTMLVLAAPIAMVMWGFLAVLGE